MDSIDAVEAVTVTVDGCDGVLENIGSVGSRKLRWCFGGSLGLLGN